MEFFIPICSNNQRPKVPQVLAAFRQNIVLHDLDPRGLYFPRFANLGTKTRTFCYQIEVTHVAARSRGGNGDRGGVSREALVDGDVNERGEPLHEEAYHLV